ncbi:MAG: YdcF family protein [Vallitaleaceae bacterium]|nr:YdcF family protein [Vallitaleaceae bacterium]
MKKIKQKKLIISLIVLLIILVIVFPRLGKWLVDEDEIVKSDIIVVLMGSVPDRILEAVDLYHDGLADQIVMVNSHMVGYDILLSRGVKIPGNAQLSKSAANLLGIQDEDALILDGDAKSTQDEAIVIKEYLKDKENIDSIILVTSKYHSARAKKIFVKALDGLNQEVIVTSSPSKYDTYNSEQWWRNREDVKRVIIEYLKLFNFYTREQFQL